MRMSDVKRDSFNYIKSQFDNVKVTPKSYQLKITSEAGATNYLNITKEQLDKIEAILQEAYALEVR